MADLSQQRDNARLEFEKTKWADEVRLLQQEIDLKVREIDLKTKEQEVSSSQLIFNQSEAAWNRWTNPLVVAVFAASVAAGGNAVVAHLNGSAQRETEQLN
jgi:hypothetical protein